MKKKLEPGEVLVGCGKHEHLFWHICGKIEQSSDSTGKKEINRRMSHSKVHYRIHLWDKGEQEKD